VLFTKNNKMDISLINDATVVVTLSNGSSYEYDIPIEPSPKWKWNGSSALQLSIGDDKFSPCALADLTINDEAPADLAAAKIALRAVFPDTDSSNGGSGVTIYGPYASNAAAITAGRTAGDLYKSASLSVEGSPQILIVV
jgi:hypothetical protein